MWLLFLVCSPSGSLPQQGLSLPVSGNLWPVLSLESVESTETQDHRVQCKLDVSGLQLLRKDGDIVVHHSEDEQRRTAFALSKHYLVLLGVGHM